MSILLPKLKLIHGQFDYYIAAFRWAQTELLLGRNQEC